MNLRKEKAARLKIQVLDNTLKLVGKKPFEDIFVDDLCAKVKISKVTFFKYFPQKEDVLLYYFRIWCLHRCVELQAKPKDGLQGIYYLGDKLSEEFDTHPGMMLSLLGYLVDFTRPPKPFPVKHEEKVLLYPDSKEAHSIEILSLDQMIEKFTLEAIFKKEITKSSSTRDLSNLFLTVLMGTLVTAHINQVSPVKFFLRKNIDMLMKGLQ
jgi:AcrR family transcriptional regulator